MFQLINVGKRKGGPSTFRLSWDYYPTSMGITWKLHKILRDMARIGILRNSLGQQIWRKYREFHKIGQSW